MKSYQQATTLQSQNHTDLHYPGGVVACWYVPGLTVCWNARAHTSGLPEGAVCPCCVPSNAVREKNGDFRGAVNPCVPGQGAQPLQDECREPLYIPEPPPNAPRISKLWTCAELEWAAPAAAMVAWRISSQSQRRQ